MKIRSFVAWFPRDENAVDAKDPRFEGDWRHWQNGPLRVSYAPRAGTTASPASGEGLPTLILGDDGEWDARTPDENMASGVPIRYDDAARELIVCTSLVALPPVFLYRGPLVTALTSDLYLLLGMPGVRLELDQAAVVELGHFGHPLGHRTLFRDIELVPAAGRLSFGRQSDGAFRRTWQLPERQRLDWPEFLEAQIDAFTRQVKRIDVSKSFFSLTAGLDTRTVFATLASQQRLVTAATMSGPTRSLDARTAARLCRAYGVRHETVTFDDRFVRDLPAFIEKAARYSGGQASLGQAPEVYMYDQLGSSYSSRLSGNLGNQVGRGGTEGISVRAAELAILAPRLRGNGAPAGHWLLRELNRDERAKLGFIFHSEIPFTLTSNFSIGNHYAAQQTPYASRTLIETLALRPATIVGAPSGSKWRMRLRDLNHRFLGEPEKHSFQRTLVKRLGGFAADYPVNWGWRPAGGVSPAGIAIGSATFLGMFSRAKGVFEWTGLPALHDFRESRRWLRSDLRSFTFDTLRSQAIRDADLFDWGVLSPLLDEHFGGRRSHYESVTFALDVALAHRIFCR